MALWEGSVSRRMHLEVPPTRLRPRRLLPGTAVSGWPG